MPNINFETGLKTFNINGDPDRTIAFAPSDAAFVRSVYDGLEKLDACQQKYREQMDSTGDPEAILGLVDSCDKEVRVIIDGIFEQRGTSDTVFGELNTCGVASGMPIWAGFIIALISECDDYLSTQEKATNPKLQKLLKKYKK